MHRIGKMSTHNYSIVVINAVFRSRFPHCTSSHPSHCKRAVPFGVALRIKRNCSTNDFLQNRCKEYKGYLKSQNYPAELVDKQFDKALSISRSELLSKKVKPDKKVFSTGA